MEAVKTDVRRLQKRLDNQRRRRDARTQLSHWTLQTAMLIALILGYDFSAAAEWLHRKRRRGSPLPEGVLVGEVVVMLEEVFLSMAVDVLASWSDREAGPLPLTVRKTAEKYVHGYRLANWVRKHNVSRGCAVPTQLLIDQYNRYVASPENAFLQPVDSSALSSGRSWASRWRAAFGGKHTKLRVEDPIPLEERRIKAVRRNVLSQHVLDEAISETQNSNAVGPILVQFAGPVSGPFFGPRFGSTLTKIEKAAPFWGPFSGP